jgi:hypothetical protein
MIGNFNETKGWEILCDQCKDFVIGYIGQIEKPNDENYYGFICSNCNIQPEEIENTEQP